MVRSRIVALLVALVLQVSTASAVFAHPGAHPGHEHNADAGTYTLVILHTNDMHGHLLPEVDKKIAPETDRVGGAAALAGVIGQERGKYTNVLLLDGGDIAQGTPISNLFRGKAMLEFMNMVKYDAGTVGNHEFDWGPEAFTRMVHWAHFPIVCANLVEKKTGTPPTGVKEFIVKKINGVNVGITGLVTPITPTISFPKNVEPFEFLPAAESMKKVLPKMKEAGAQVIVVVSHLGDEGDQQLAKEVSGINVIVGGHSHKPLPRPLFVNDTVIVQAGKYMRYLGAVKVAIDRKTWKVVDYTKDDALIAVVNSKVPIDGRVAALVKKYEDQVAPMMDQRLGEASTDLSKSPAPGTTDSPLGNLITDALRWKVTSDIAIYNAGGIRSEINKGAIKLGDVYTLLPFDNFVVTLSLSGAQIEKLVEQGLKDKHGTIQVSGLSFNIDAAGKATDITVDGKPLDPSKMYRVATVDFLAEGGDGLTVLKEGKDKQIDELARDVFSAFVRKRTPVAAPESGRIKKATTTSSDSH
ncbi:MAG: hypothetical protein FJX76_00770 [Armatimonadetes bacterium]|nr:hypothetical protein [Armatimonadota bacterium]